MLLKMLKKDMLSVRGSECGRGNKMDQSESIKLVGDGGHCYAILKPGPGDVTSNINCIRCVP